MTRRAGLAGVLLAGLCACDPSAAVDAGPVDAGPGPPAPCGDDSPLALAACVDEDRYAADLSFVAAERVPGSEHWQAVQDHCAMVLEGLGFEVERHAYGTGVNVIGVLEGSDMPDRRVLIGAHYDHIADCPGADDNASGVAGVLEAARVLSRRALPRTLVAACWDEEERGLLGSTAYVTRELDAGRTFDVYYNFEMIGFTDPDAGSQRVPLGFDALFPDTTASLEAHGYRGDFIAVVADETAEEELALYLDHAYRLHLRAEPLLLLSSLTRGLDDLRRSDHAPFWDRGIPAMMLTDTASFRYWPYHCIGGLVDTVDQLDTEFAARVVGATVASAAVSLGLR